MGSENRIVKIEIGESNCIINGSLILKVVKMKNLICFGNWFLIKYKRTVLQLKKFVFIGLSILKLVYIYIVWFKNK